MLLMNASWQFKRQLSDPPARDLQIFSHRMRIYLLSSMTIMRPRKCTRALALFIKRQIDSPIARVLQDNL
jgi:hypothetical protein